MFYQKYPNIFSKYTTVSWVTQSDNKVDRTPSPHPVPPLGLSLDFFLSKSFLLDTHHRSPGWFHWNFKIVKKYATLWKVREKIDMNSLYMKRRFWDNVKIQNIIWLLQLKIAKHHQFVRTIETLSFFFHLSIENILYNSGGSRNFKKRGARSRRCRILRSADWFDAPSHFTVSFCSKSSE